jgi:diketogulonate reductase-like aldo/keto reductase
MGATSPSHKKDIFKDNINKELFHNIGDLIKEMKLKIKIMDSKIKILENIQYTITSDAEKNKTPTIENMNNIIKNLDSIISSITSIIPATKKLNNNLNIPLIGLGTSRIKNVEEVVYHSIKDGVRLIDTALLYKNEEDIGKGIKKAINEGIVKREELFIVDKLWIDDRINPEKALREALKKLDMEYIDLYLDHWPSGDIFLEDKKTKMIPIFELWPKMEDLVNKGLTKSIGCSNYNVQSLLNLLSFCKIRPVVNQVEFHPYYYQKGLKDFCEKENIALMAYYPLAKGNGAKNYIKEHNGEMDLFHDKLVKTYSKKYNKSYGQIILNWHIHQGIIAIPSTSKCERMKENLESLFFEMSEEDVNNLCCYGKKIKFCGCKRFFGYNIMA